MSNKKNALHIFMYIILLMIIFFLLVYIALGELLNDFKNDDDYKKLGINIEKSEVEYCTKYDYDSFRDYKVYNLVNSNMNNYKDQLESSNMWSRNKFYEYMMENFYEIVNNEKIPVDRENLYFYNEKEIYSIFDVKNMKLYYLKAKSPFDDYENYRNLLGVNVENCESREIYSVKGGIQGDGTEYYVYKFNNMQNDINQKNILKIPKWSKNKCDDEKLSVFSYNQEVKNIENGYYYFRWIDRSNPEENVSEEKSTGLELGIYDYDNKIFYYYWNSI